MNSYGYGLRTHSARTVQRASHADENYYAIVAYGSSATYVLVYYFYYVRSLLSHTQELIYDLLSVDHRGSEYHTFGVYALGG